VDQWKLPVHKLDDHSFDCVVGSSAAASMQRVERVGPAVQRRCERKRLKLSELQKGRRWAGIRPVAICRFEAA